MNIRVTDPSKGLGSKLMRARLFFSETEKEAIAESLQEHCFRCLVLNNLSSEDFQRLTGLFERMGLTVEII
jgi:hypothetical protein